MSTGTIYALSSGAGRAGVAVIRVSGPGVPAVLERMVGGLPPARMAVLRPLRHPVEGHLLDQALVLSFPAPGSFTGEAVAEFHVHGGRAVVAAVLSALAAVPGCRPAEAGEFTYRAFLNGKLDLTAAEGLADLIDSETERQRRAALQAAGGAHRQQAERWRAQLLDAMALLEAMIDFSDEGDIPDDTRALAETHVRALVAGLEAARASSRRGERLRTGVQVVLAGPPNAGKSTLLNALARRDVAIVSPEAGTTRDVIEVALDLDGVPVVLADTAGLRTDAGRVEQEGIRRARLRMDAADLVLWLVAPDIPDSIVPPQGPAVWRIGTKADRAAVAGVECTVSAETGAGMDELLERLSRFAADTIGGEDAVPAVAHVRHKDAIEGALAALHRALDGWWARPVELTAEDLRQAARALGRITGAVDVEAVLDVVFGRFCVGK